MNIENLTKHQIILLTLLISFVTSIATGIVTVALMNQAPVGVTQTINRIVEKTIETVTTPTTENNTQTIVKETVVVSTDDQVVSAVDKNSKGVVRIYRTNSDPQDSSSMMLVGLCVVVNDDNIIAADNSIIFGGGNYFVASASGKLYTLTVLRAISGEKIALLKLKQDEKEPLSLSKVILSSSSLKLGQSVVYIGGEKQNIVSTGIVSSVNMKDEKITDAVASSTASTTEFVERKQTVVDSIETNISENSLISGGLLLNLSGDVVGLKATYLNSAKTDLFVPVNELNKVLSAWIVSQKK